MNKITPKDVVFSILIGAFVTGMVSLFIIMITLNDINQKLDREYKIEMSTESPPVPLKVIL